MKIEITEISKFDPKLVTTVSGVFKPKSIPTQLIVIGGIVLLVIVVIAGGWLYYKKRKTTNSLRLPTI